MKRLTYLIVLFSLVVSISLPMIFQYVGTYSAPTSVYALETMNGGHLSKAFISSSHQYWGDAITYEDAYPLPSLIVSEFAMVTGIPLEYVIFLPIAGLASIVYFILAKTILCNSGNYKYGLFFSALFFAFITFANLHVNYIGRATTGVIFFTFFLYCYMKYLICYFKKNKTSSWFIAALIFAIASGFTYYTSSLNILVITLVMGLLLSLPVLIKRRYLIFPGLPIAVISISLFIYNTFFSTLINANSLSAVFSNAATYAKAALRLESEQNTAWVLFYGYRSVDQVTQFLSRVFFIFEIFSIISLIVVFFIYCPRISLNLSHKKADSNNLTSGIQPWLRPVWLFSLLVLLCGISGIGYLSSGALNPFGWLIRFGPIPLFFLVLSLLQYSGAGFISGKNPARKMISYPMKVLKTMLSSKRKKVAQIIAVCLVLIVLLGLLGSFRQSWLYGSGGAKPFGNDKVQSASNFILSYSNASCITLTGDSYYMSLLFFRSSLSGELNNVIPEPLIKDAVTLYLSETTGDSSAFFVNMTRRNIDYLLTVDTAEPLWGDAWGYAVTLTDFDTLISSSNLVYNGYLQLYQFR